MPLFRLTRILTWLLCLSALAVASARAQDPASLMKVALLAEPAAIAPGEPFTVGIRLSLKQHWHTYWRNPGDSGEPAQVTWTLPQGFATSDLEWPAPSVIQVGPAVSFGYEGEAMLLARITPPRDAKPGTSIDLAAHISYLVCEKICIPGEASVALTLPVTEKSAQSQANNPAFDAARDKLPQPSPWRATFGADAKAITLSLQAEQLRGDAIRSATFFPHDNTLIDNSAPQVLQTDGPITRIAIERSQIAKVMPQRIDGVLVLEEDVGGKSARHAFAIEAMPSAAAAGEGGLTLLYAVALALIGGIILNLMPCVFPVLSIKILHLTQHQAETPRRVRLHGVAYALGILTCFTALASVLYGLRAGGTEVGWGFQLQSPLVVATLAFVLFALGLSLSGILTVGASLTRVGGNRLLQQGGLTGSFFAGVLATVVATPCTAPFMGASIGFALLQPFAVGLAVFLALGFGLALPFLLLAFVPALQRVLPRPGPWMETLKQFLAFPLYATVAWLVWVLSFQVGLSGLLVALAGLVLIAFGAWAYGQSQARSQLPARAFQGVAAVSIAAIVALVFAIDLQRPAAITAQDTSARSEAFSQQKLDTLLASGQPVFVNMTAAWCITCLVNERTALSADVVRAAFTGKGIAYLKGDWTNRNPEITRLLGTFGRSGVPLYVLYRGGREPVVLPQILTQSVVLDALGQI
jgi:thiol:disulfide interchange protein